MGLLHHYLNSYKCNFISSSVWLRSDLTYEDPIASLCTALALEMTTENNYKLRLQELDTLDEKRL